ncbi:MAG: hypothetical protein HYR67_01130 [Bacteroidetes bacterium]|nr:hypothetical protein [Bacteroidota bacterium]
MNKPFLTVLLFVAACVPEKRYAPDRNFYLEIITHRKDDASLKLATYIKEQIPQKKYTITNHSGLTWPFYKELNLDERISKDSLMPPHWFVHRMIPLSTDQAIKPNEFLVRIDLMPQTDTIPNYSVEILRKDSTGLMLSGQSGVHYIDSTEFTSSSSLFEVYLKSIIRYSFK